MQPDRAEPDPKAQLALGKNPVFAALSAEALDAVIAVGRLRHYRSGALIFVQGEPPDDVFCVVSGRVSVFSTAPDGRQQIYTFLGPGEMFGELGVLGDMPRSASVECVEDATLWAVRGQAFLQLLAAHPPISRALMGALARQVVAVDAVAEDLLFLDLKGRVAKRLLALADQSPTTSSPSGEIFLTWEISQAQLASLCSATRENTSRVLSEFQRRGLIQRQGRRYVLRDLETLRRLAGL